MKCLCCKEYICFKCEREAQLNVKTTMAEMLLDALLKKEALTAVEQSEVKTIFIENSAASFLLKYDEPTLDRLANILNGKEKPLIMEVISLPVGEIKNYAPVMTKEEREAKEAFDYISVIYDQKKSHPVTDDL